MDNWSIKLSRLIIVEKKIFRWSLGWSDWKGYILGYIDIMHSIEYLRYTKTSPFHQNYLNHKLLLLLVWVFHRDKFKGKLWPIAWTLSLSRTVALLLLYICNLCEMVFTYMLPQGFSPDPSLVFSCNYQ